FDKKHSCAGCVSNPPRFSVRPVHYRPVVVPGCSRLVAPVRCLFFNRHRTKASLYEQGEEIEEPGGRILPSYPPTSVGAKLPAPRKSAPTDVGSYQVWATLTRSRLQAVTAGRRPVSRENKPALRS